MSQLSQAIPLLRPWVAVSYTQSKCHICRCRSGRSILIIAASRWIQINQRERSLPGRTPNLTNRVDYATSTPRTSAPLSAQENVCCNGGAHYYSGAPHWGSSISHVKTDFVKIVSQIQLTMSLSFNRYTADNAVKPQIAFQQYQVTPHLTSGVSK